MIGHVDPETLAQLVEGTLADDQAVAVKAHLEQCRSCVAAYADAVRYRAAWLVDDRSFAADSQTLAWAGAGENRRSPRFPVLMVTIPGAAAAIVALVIGVGLFARGEHPPVGGFVLPPIVRVACEQSAMRGLVLPGVTREATDSPRELRSGRSGDAPGLEHEVGMLIEEYEHGGREPDAGARMLAGLLATGEIDVARDYGRECVRRNPDHVPMLVFASDVRYRSNDLAGAEELLRTAARLAPRDPVVALDLALVLKQRGRSEDARVRLTQLSRSPMSLVAARATRELSDTGKASNR